MIQATLSLHGPLSFPVRGRISWDLVGRMAGPMRGCHTAKSRGIEPARPSNRKLIPGFYLSSPFACLFLSLSLLFRVHLCVTLWHFFTAPYTHAERTKKTRLSPFDDAQRTLAFVFAFCRARFPRSRFPFVLRPGDFSQPSDCCVTLARLPLDFLNAVVAVMTRRRPQTPHDAVG